MGERMTPARVLAAAGLALVFLTSASVALAAGRVALVVGNSTYSHIARLPNPENDAADMAAALRRLGFDVTTAQDADRASPNEGRCGSSPARAWGRTWRSCSTPATTWRWTA